MSFPSCLLYSEEVFVGQTFQKSERGSEWEVKWRGLSNLERPCLVCVFGKMCNRDHESWLPLLSVSLARKTPNSCSSLHSHIFECIFDVQCSLCSCVSTYDCVHLTIGGRHRFPGLWFGCGAIDAGSWKHSCCSLRIQGMGRE